MSPAHTRAAIRLAAGAAIVLVLGWSVPGVYAEVRPDQVLVVANANREDSLRLAKLYATLRGIPETNILGLACSLRETISRREYDGAIALPIRTFIQQQNLADKVRVIVTVYGVPLKAEGPAPTTRQRQLERDLTGKYRREFDALDDLIDQIAELVGESTTQPVPRTVSGPATRAIRNVDRFGDDLEAVIARVHRLGEGLQKRVDRETDPQSKQSLLTRVVDLNVKLRGVEQFAAAAGANAPIAAHVEPMRRKLHELMPVEPEERDLGQCYELARQLGGQLLLLATVRDDVIRLREKDSLAAVDDELPLVMHRDYMLAGRMPNALNPRLADHALAAGFTPVFMTARLDGPAPEVVERMIRDAVAVQEKGLVGKAYIDARGRTSGDGFYPYDEDLRKLAHLLETQTKIPTVLDNREELFAPNSCSDAALYCGWYSLKKYIPAFQFVPGAVAWHIASFEAQSLHSPQLDLWCPKLLAAGACATIGPVDEPFLDSFPLPSEFFSLLLSGKYCLAEVFFMTKRYNSWRVILIGDPLYCPFARNPQLPEPNLNATPLGVKLLP